jgi:secreted PhoX family phosphatase
VVAFLRRRAARSRAHRARVHQPDNLVIDRRGDLWVATDISAEHINAPAPTRRSRTPGSSASPSRARTAGNRHSSRRSARRRRRGPLRPGESALFLSVQHPGERHGTRFSASDAPRGSNWPARRSGTPPQPAVVAMRRR